MKSYQEITNILNKKPVMPVCIPTLENISAAIQDYFPSLTSYSKQMIVIAGTNGKGSVAKTLEALLLTSGKEVCLFTSPHLISITERFCKNAEQITPDQFSEHYLVVESYIEKWKLSHFEALTLLALSFFKEQIVRGAYCIWEVGMGGRWDATNAIPHHYSVLTTIGHDHQKFLGNSIEEIASNKFDIIQKDSIVINGYTPKSCQTALSAVIVKNTATIYNLRNDASFRSKYTFEAKEPLKHYIVSKGKQYPLRLLGDRGFENTLLALYCLDVLQINIQENHLECLHSIKWPHRFSELKNNLAPCPVYLSGDHNPEGIASLVNIVNRLKYKKLWIIVGITEGRDPNLIFDPLVGIRSSQLILTESPFKGIRILEYQKEWNQYATSGAMCMSDPVLAFTEACKLANSDDMIIATGSLYLTGKIDELFNSGNKNLS